MLRDGDPDERTERWREGGRRRGNADVGARAREAFEKVANV